MFSTVAIMTGDGGFTESRLARATAGVLRQAMPATKPTGPASGRGGGGAEVGIVLIVAWDAEDVSEDVEKWLRMRGLRGLGGL